MHCGQIVQLENSSSLQPCVLCPTMIKPACLLEKEWPIKPGNILSNFLAGPIKLFRLDEVFLRRNRQEGRRQQLRLSSNDASSCTRAAWAGIKPVLKTLWGCA